MVNRMVSDNQIAVSVYCLTYNHEKYIRKTLDGFVMQKTSFPFEVIVHDDASTDGTVDIVREYEDKYPNIIKGIYQKENQKSQKIDIFGNYILPLIHGKYIASCEGDDFWISENKLQLQYDAMEAHPECSLCVCKVATCNEDGTPNERTIPNARFRLNGEGGIVLSMEKTLELLWEDGEYPFQTSAYFFRKTALLPLDHELKNILVRDRGKLRQLLLSGLFYYIHEPLSTYRLFSVGSWSSKLVRDGNKGMENTLTENIKMEIIFNQFTKGRYQKSIIICVFEMIYRVATFHAEYAQKLYHEFLSEFSDEEITQALSECIIPKKSKKLLIEYRVFIKNPYSIEKKFSRRTKRTQSIKNMKAIIKKTRLGMMVYRLVKKRDSN